MPTPSVFPTFMKAQAGGGAGTVNIVEGIVVTMEPDKIIEVMPALEVAVEISQDVEVEDGIIVEIEDGVIVEKED